MNHLRVNIPSKVVHTQGKVVCEGEALMQRDMMVTVELLMAALCLVESNRRFHEETSVRQNWNINNR